MSLPNIPPQAAHSYPTRPDTAPYYPPGDHPYGGGWQTPGHYGQPTVNVFATTQPAPRQSCMIHALLLVTTLGIGNVAYAIWHNHHHAR